MERFAAEGAENDILVRVIVKKGKTAVRLPVPPEHKRRIFL